MSTGCWNVVVLHMSGHMTSLSCLKCQAARLHAPLPQNMACTNDYYVFQDILMF